jgi:hypothetical protein
MREHRFTEATWAAAWLTEKKGWTVFSPITHSHPLHKIAGLSGSWDFWCKIDTDYLDCSCRIVNLELPGWKESTGVTAENILAKERGLEVWSMRLRSDGTYLLKQL